MRRRISNNSHKREVFNEFANKIIALLMIFVGFMASVCLIEPIFTNRFRWRSLIICVSILILFGLLKRYNKKGLENTKLSELIIIYISGSIFIIFAFPFYLNMILLSASILHFIWTLARYRIVKEKIKDRKANNDKANSG